MANSKNLKFVFVHQAYKDVYKEIDWLQGHFHKMGYFRCSSVETQSTYLCLTIVADDENNPSFEIQIPHNAILCILTDPLEKNLGFRLQE